MEWPVHHFLIQYQLIPEAISPPLRGMTNDWTSGCLHVHIILSWYMDRSSTRFNRFFAMRMDLTLEWLGQPKIPPKWLNFQRGKILEGEGGVVGVTEEREKNDWWERTKIDWIWSKTSEADMNKVDCSYGSVKKKPKEYIFNMMLIWVKSWRKVFKCAAGDQWATTFHVYCGGFQHNVALTLIPSIKFMAFDIPVKAFKKILPWGYKQINC